MILSSIWFNMPVCSILTIGVKRENPRAVFVALLSRVQFVSMVFGSAMYGAAYATDNVISA